jgi:hypothetical protein
MSTTLHEVYEPHGSTTSEPEWTIVCVGCLRIQRASEWTDEQASDTGGHSTGFCDPCARTQRLELEQLQRAA